MSDRPEDDDLSDELESDAGDRDHAEPRSPVSPAGEAPPLRHDLPEPPDPARVRKLREELDRQRRLHRSAGGRDGVDTGQRIRDIGSYTLIPVMMGVGPALGYGLGRLVEKQWGGEPWPVVLGTLFGLAAAFRQVYLLLLKRQNSGD